MVPESHDRLPSFWNYSVGVQHQFLKNDVFSHIRLFPETLLFIRCAPNMMSRRSYRSAANGSTSGSRTSGLVAPYWVRVVRNGSTFTGYFSSDGVNWTQQGTVSISMLSSPQYKDVST